MVAFRRLTIFIKRRRATIQDVSIDVASDEYTEMQKVQLGRAELCPPRVGVRPF
jgi:hypothetical protein